MHDTARHRHRYLIALWREGLWGKWIAGVYALAGGFVFLRDDFWRPGDEGRWKIVNLIPHLSLAWWMFGAALILAVWIFEASFRTSKKKDNLIFQMGKISRSDMQNMLGGMYVDDTFFYSAHVIHVCKEYSNAFEIGQLIAKFEKISVQAPARSMASITVQFLHSRGIADYKFYLKDGNGSEREIQSIYEPIIVFLSDASDFEFKLSVCDGFDLDRASIMVSVSAWTK